MVNFLILIPAIKGVLTLARGLGYGRVPKRWRWVVPVALGVASGALDKLAMGADWKQAALDAVAGLGAIGLHEAVEGARGKRR